MTRCTTPDCLRKPAFPDQAKCAEHRIRWEPVWIQRAREREGGLRKDLTGISS